MANCPPGSDHVDNSLVMIESNAASSGCISPDIGISDEATAVAPGVALDWAYAVAAVIPMLAKPAPAAASCKAFRRWSDVFAGLWGSWLMKIVLL